MVATATLEGGRVVVAGERTVAAFRRDGRVDRRFGSHGLRNLPVLKEGKTAVEDVATDSSGRIIVLAASRFANGGVLAMVARMSADGKLDTSFANDGVLLTDFGLPAPRPMGPDARLDAPTNVLPTSLAVDGQDRIVIGGTTVAAIAPCRSAGEQPHHSAYLARLLTDGSLDSSFGTAGITLIEGQPFYDEQQPYMGGIAIRGGSIFYATDQNDGANCEGFGGGLLVRLNEAGGRDSSFGSAGVLGITPGGSRPHQIAIDRRGRILVMRDATPGETKYLDSFQVVSRWNTNGTLDTGFGRGGEVAVKLPGEESGLDMLSVDARNRPLLAGDIAPARTPRQSKRHAFPPPRFALVRLNARGRLDRTFGRDGRVATGFGRRSRSIATDIAVRGGKAIVAGPVRSRNLPLGRGFALARYQLGGQDDW
jgi:uncharacterized delta-60 repeat protein